MVWRCELTCSPAMSKKGWNVRYGLFLGGSHISCLGGHETKPVQILVYFFKNVIIIGQWTSFYPQVFIRKHGFSLSSVTNLLSQHLGCRDRRITGAPWLPAYQNNLSFTFRELPCLKGTRWRMRMPKTSSGLRESMGPSTCTWHMHK